MIERANQNAHNLSLEKEDYVYFGKDPRRTGQKFKLKHAGPFFIHQIDSPHLYSFIDPNTNKIISKVHINRLKPAYICVPNPCEYFMDRVINKQDTVDTASASHDNLISEQSSTNNEIQEVPNLRRSTRQRQKPIRFRDDNFVTSDTETRYV
ncbi:unnamed protein product [Mytilus edulis]|uniref:Uncharacterized protein n=1 Tax=Mytilus edulis TaxID=6550 RepID=A0A8S3TVH3_MYTED|nr:unnamed protein product [Mytilus edulis]